MSTRPPVPAHKGEDTAAPDTAVNTAGVWAAMSHEIRTPLMGVMGMLEILARTSLTDEQRRIMATVGESSTALMRIVDDMLDLAKLESARLALSPTSTDLTELLEGCTELLANQAEPKGLSITCEVDFNLPRVSCDALRLRQVLLNLGMNAVKFTEAGHVALSAHLRHIDAQNAAIRFCISDSGIGIPQELQAFLFQPFSQLAMTAGQGLGGVGLGLAICRNLVEAMGGKVDVESASGKGSRFFVDVTFPIVAPSADAHVIRLDDLLVVAADAGEPALQVALRYLEAAGARIERVEALNSLSGNTLAARYLTAGKGRNVVVVIGPSAEPEDVEAATGVLQLASAPAKLPVLWLHPRAIGGAVSLARRGVRGIRAHPLRRAVLLAAVAGAQPLTTELDAAPILTRRLDASSFAASEVETVAAARAEGRVILVAEDNVVNQEVLRQQLAILGFDCDIASTGTAAMQALQERSYLLLLCDCHMPSMDGFELTRLIRAGEKADGRHLPIVAITANAMRGEEERCRAAGMDDYLAKPIEIKSLQAALDRWLPVACDPVFAVPARSAPASAKNALNVEASIGTVVGAVDLRNLIAVFGDDAVRLRPVLAQWRVVIETSCADLKRALGAMQWDDASAAAHHIKGSAGIAGAHSLSTTAALLEQALHTQDLAGVGRESKRVFDSAERALKEIQQWWDSQAAFSATDVSSVNR